MAKTRLIWTLSDRIECSASAPTLFQRARVLAASEKSQVMRYLLYKVALGQKQCGKKNIERTWRCHCYGM